MLQIICFIALAGLGVATTLPTTVCVDHIYPCGSPPTVTMRYGGCHDMTLTPTYERPPCPTVGIASSSCTSTGTVCDDRFKTCGSPTPTATLTYGACHDACITLTYSEPPCPTRASSNSRKTSRSRSAPRCLA